MLVLNRAGFTLALGCGVEAETEHTDVCQSRTDGLLEEIPSFANLWIT